MRAISTGGRDNERDRIEAGGSDNERQELGPQVLGEATMSCGN